MRIVRQYYGTNCCIQPAFPNLSVRECGVEFKGQQQNGSYNWPLP